MSFPSSLFGAREPAYQRVSTREDEASPPTPVPGATHRGSSTLSPAAHTALVQAPSPAAGRRGVPGTPVTPSSTRSSDAGEGPRWTRVLLLTMAALGLGATVAAALRTVQAPSAGYSVRESSTLGLQEDLVPPPGRAPVTTHAEKRLGAKRDKFCSKVDSLLRRYPGFDSPSEKGSSAKYPISSDQFNQSYHPAGSCHVQRLFRRMVWPDGKDIVVDVLGSSMTSGVGCRPSEGQGADLECAWPQRLQKWLARSFPRLSIVVHNRADEGASVKEFSERVGQWSDWKEGQVDLALTDLTVSHQMFREGAQPIDSDAGVGEVKKWTRLLLDQVIALGDKAPSLVMLKTFRMSRNRDDCLSHCNPDDVHIKKARLGEPGLCWCKWWWRMSEWDHDEVHEFKVPAISYRDAVWQDPDSVDARMRSFFWTGESNPSAITHRLVADTVGYGLLRLLQDQCESGHVMRPDDGQTTCREEISGRQAAAHPDQQGN